MTLRVALLVDSPSTGTHANFASRLAVGLVQTGRVRTTIVCYRAHPAPPWLPPEVRVHRLGPERASHSLGALVRYLRSDQPDVLVTRQVHANLLGLTAGGIARLTGWSGKLVLTHDHPAALSHASDWRDNKWLVRVGYRFADGVVANSPTVRDDAVRWCRLAPSSVGLVSPPIIPFADGDADVPHPWLEDGEPPVFLTTSRLVAYKRVDLLIEAFCELQSRHDARLLILGQGPESEDLAGRIERFGLVGRAEVVGWVADPRQWALRATAFVFASEEEGFAQVLIEAMSVSCPVIAADAVGGGPRFVTDDGRYGVLVPRNDRAALVAAMEGMLSPATRDAYSARGLERIRAFSPLRSATALVDYVESLAPTASGGPGTGDEPSPPPISTR